MAGYAALIEEKRPVADSAVTTAAQIAVAEDYEDPDEDQGGADEIDAEVLSEFVASLPGEILEKTIGKVITEAEEAAVEIEALIGAGNAADIRPVAHRAAGGVAIIGASFLHECLTRLEKASVDGDLAAAREALTDFTERLPETVSVIREFTGSGD